MLPQRVTAPVDVALHLGDRNPQGPGDLLVARLFKMKQHQRHALMRRQRAKRPLEALTVDAPKTKLLAQKLKGMGLDNVLIITDAIDDNLHLSSRNLPHVNIITVANADPVSLIRHDKVIVTRSAVAKIEELFA